jgi:predicted nucleotidyltransferase
MDTSLRDSVLEILEINRGSLKRYGVEAISLFGSVARGDAGPRSDVDLLVDVQRGTTLFGLARLQYYLEDLLGRPVDLVTRDALRPQMRDSIMAEAIHAG